MKHTPNTARAATMAASAAGIAGAIALLSGCAYNDSGPAASAGISAEFAGVPYAVEDTGALPPGHIGLTDVDTHFFPYVSALPLPGYAETLDGRYVLVPGGYYAPVIGGNPLIYLGPGAATRPAAPTAAPSPAPPPAASAPPRPRPGARSPASAARESARAPRARARNRTETP